MFFLKSSVSLYYFTHTNKQTHTNRRHVQEVKTIWAIFPAIILILITLPSLSLFFSEIYFSRGPFLKVSIEFVTILFLFYVLVFWWKGMWDPGFLTREWTGTPCTGRWRLNQGTTTHHKSLLMNSSGQTKLSFSDPKTFRAPRRLELMHIQIMEIYIPTPVWSDLKPGELWLLEGDNPDVWQSEMQSPPEMFYTHDLAIHWA